MVTKLVENRLHFKSGQNILDEDATLDRACEIIKTVLNNSSQVFCRFFLNTKFQSQLGFRPCKDLVPQTGFQGAFHFGQVEKRAGLEFGHDATVVEH